MSFRYQFPPLHEEVLSNGLRTMLVADQEQPVVTVVLQCVAGRFCVAAAQQGCAELCVALWQKGPASMAPDEFAQKMEMCGAQLFADAADEHISIGVRCLKSVFQEVFSLFWEMVVNPGFDAGEIARLKKEMVTSIEAEYSDPQALAVKHFQSQLGGADHPTGLHYTHASIQKLSVETVRKFYEDHIGPHHSILIAGGDFSVAEFTGHYGSQLRSWRPQIVPGGYLTQSPAPSASTVIRCIDNPALSQTSLMIGHATIGESHPDKENLLIGNYILGGGNFSSRLMSAVRSQTGHTYGIASHVAQYMQFGIFSISTTTQNHQVAAVLETILKVYNALGLEGVSAAEVEKACQYAQGSLAFELEGIGSVIDKLLWLRTCQRDNRYLEEYGARLRAISAQTVNQALASHLHAPVLVISAVGRRAEIQTALEQFGTVLYYNYRVQP